MATPERAVVHPLALLGILDHAKRAALAPGRRVVGVLLGAVAGRTVHVTGAFAVPFEEVAGDAGVWYVDADYRDGMAELCRRVNAAERPVGWYHSGPRLRASDLAIHEAFRAGALGAASPLLAVVDAGALLGQSELPADGVVRAYVAVEDAGADGGAACRTWAHVPVSVEADEPEEVGVEHLLRADGLHAGGRGSPGRAQDALSALDAQLRTAESYLGAVAAGTLPPAHAVLARVQDVLSALQAHAGRAEDAGADAAAVAAATNDRLAAVLVASLARAAVALHNLVLNRAPSAV